MSKKSARIAELLQQCHGQRLDPHYLGYFECFNRGLFFEAHDVLEELWLAQKHSANYRFYKGLIQLAGAFVHLQKNRRRPAVALFKLARANVGQYPALHEHLDLSGVLRMIDDWIERLEASHGAANPFPGPEPPRLTLMD